jgi:hypothetical protein
MATILKYNLKEITDISISGFEYNIPIDTIEIINYLAYQIGSTQIITSGIFEKKQPPKEISNNYGKIINKKRKPNAMEINNDDWETIRTFQPTKLEQKSGFDADIDKIRMYFNKLTDKTFIDMRHNIIEQLEKTCVDYPLDESKYIIASLIYDLASSNKFYSSIFTDLYSELAVTYDWIKNVFNIQYANILSQYTNIEYFDSDKDYNKFCDMNKTNEKRKSITLFIVNLSINGFISKHGVLLLLKQLLQTVLTMMSQKDNKNEVDELTENIAILFSKEMIEELIKHKTNVDLLIDGKSIISIITTLAKSKVKDYPSLSNKAIFKYMDLVEI